MMFWSEMVVVDGEELFIVSPDKWKIIEKKGGIDDGVKFSKGCVNLVSRSLEFTKRSENFSYALFKRRFGKHSFIWIGTMLFMSDSYSFRVSIQKEKCESCGKLANIANPKDPILYSHLNYRLPIIPENLVVGCPYCGYSYRECAIWAEPVTEEVN